MLPAADEDLCFSINHFQSSDNNFIVCRSPEIEFMILGIASSFSSDPFFLLTILENRESGWKSCTDLLLHQCICHSSIHCICSSSFQCMCRNSRPPWSVSTQQFYIHSVFLSPRKKPSRYFKSLFLNESNEVSTRDWIQSYFWFQDQRDLMPLLLCMASFLLLNSDGDPG